MQKKARNLPDWKSHCHTKRFNYWSSTTERLLLECATIQAESIESSLFLLVDEYLRAFHWVAPERRDVDLLILHKYGN